MPVKMHKNYKIIITTYLYIHINLNILDILDVEIYFTLVLAVQGMHWDMEKSPGAEGTHRDTQMYVG